METPWWEGLTEKQRRFCEAFAENGGRAGPAAEEAGYKHPHPEGVHNLRKPTVAAALERLRKEATEKKIATREERQSFWTATLRDSEVDWRNRLKASELLGKSQADFLDRHEISGAGGGPVVLQIGGKTLTDDDLGRTR